jgi:ABC-type spermidine/putrescine transport systems, ATPase components
MSSLIECNGLWKQYRVGEVDVNALRGLSLTIEQGEFVAVMGASGSGKSTLLNILGCLDQPTRGQYRLDGIDVGGLEFDRLAEVRNRQIGFVFQSFNLIPRTSALENAQLPLFYRGMSLSEQRGKAAAALKRVGLEGREQHFPTQLSGGEQQRVALARALIIEPPVLLLDEPLSNLDPTLRRAMREELRSTLHGRGVTVLFVTHDQEDAFAVADRVALLRHGKLLQVGTPEDLYDRPASSDVAGFIGRAVLIPGVYDGSTVTITLGGVERRMAATAAPAVAGRRDVLAVLRPDALAFVPTGSPGSWPGIVISRRFAGALLAYHVRVADDMELEVYSAERAVHEGDQVAIGVAREPVAVV